MQTDDVIDSVAVGIWIVALVAAVLIGSLHLGTLLRGIIEALTHPYSMSYTGGYLAYYIAHPFQLYAPPDPVPHPTIYPPLVPLLIPTLPGIDIHIWARVVNLLAIAMSTSIIGWLAWQRTGRRAAVGVSVLVFVLSAAITGQTVLVRVDHIALLLTLAAIALFVRTDRPTPAVIALCIAAGFAKQPYAVVSIGAIGAALWMRGERQTAIAFAVETVFLGLSLLLALVLLTEGWAFQHLIVYNLAVPWYTDVFLAQHFTFLHTHGIMVGIAIAVVATRGRGGLDSPVTWLFVIGALVAMVMVWKEGAWIGYFYPVIAASAVLTADVVRDVNLTADMPSARRVVSTVVILMLVSQLFLYSIWVPTAEKDLRAWQTTRDVIDDQQPPVLAEEPSLAPGQLPVDVLMVQALVKSGVVDGDPLADAFRCGRYSTVVTWLPVTENNHGESRFTRMQHLAILSNYEPVFGTYGFSVYRYDGSRSTC